MIRVKDRNLSKLFRDLPDNEYFVTESPDPGSIYMKTEQICFKNVDYNAIKIYPPLNNPAYFPYLKIDLDKEIFPIEVSTLELFYGGKNGSK